MFLSDANMVETNGTGRIKIVASINVAGKVTTPSLCCTTLTLETTNNDIQQQTTNNDKRQTMTNDKQQWTNNEKRQTTKNKASFK